MKRVICNTSPLIVLDDLQARLVAEELGLSLTGTLGVLVDAHKAGLVESMPETLDDLEDVGFRVGDGPVPGAIGQRQGHNENV